MPEEPDEYCDIDQCDVPIERRDALRRFRQRRRVWLSWLDTDEHHAIWRTLHELVWRDVAFKALTALALNNDESALHNPLIAEALMYGHVAAQVLAIRRLTESAPKERLSLRSLVNDIKKHRSLFTRENWVCYNGLPYDYQAVRIAFLENVGKWERGFAWKPRGGPQDDAASEGLHLMFDKLAGIEPTKRGREDRLPPRLLTTVETWLNDSGADDLAKYAGTYLAHAGGPKERARLDVMVTSKKIADAIRALARATEAISLFVYGGGRAGAVVPVAQDKQFAKLDKPIMHARQEKTAYASWHLYSADWNRCLDDVEDALVGRPRSGATAPVAAVDGLIRVNAGRRLNEGAMICIAITPRAYRAIKDTLPRVRSS